MGAGTTLPSGWDPHKPYIMACSKSCSKSAATFIVAPAEFESSAFLPWGIPREPGCPRLVWVLRTKLGWVVILQAVCAPGDLVLPVNVSLYSLGSVVDQLSSFLARASHPPSSLVIPLGPYNCGLVGEEVLGPCAEIG